MPNTEHGGNLIRLASLAGKTPEAILDFSANINPLGPPDWLRPLISRQVSELVHYPDPDATALVVAVSRRYGAGADQILVGNGSTELLYLLAQVAGTERAQPAVATRQRCGRAVITVPSYTDYARAARLAGLELVQVALAEQDDFQLAPEQLDPLLNPAAIVFIGRPNNPTGQVCPAQTIRNLAQAHPECLFVVDEAFGDFVKNFESLTVNRPANVAVLLSLTKIFAIPGLRLGCAVADAALARRVRAQQPPWSVNTLAQAVGEAALNDQDYVARSRALVSAERMALLNGLRTIPALSAKGGLPACARGSARDLGQGSAQGGKIYPGMANFLLVRIDSSIMPAQARPGPAQARPGPAQARPGNARNLAQRLLAEDGIAIRVCDNFSGLDERFFRVAVRLGGENARLIAALRRVLNDRGVQPKAPHISKTHRARALMFQGTSSNAGKSVMTAALCRILLQDGYRVAPFKAQNMSLNSFVTRAGGEMGRAQVVQAQACRIEPHVRMNPILLKPSSDTGAQVILLGNPVGNMTVNEYIRYKPEAFKTVTRSYDELAAEYDVLILEGAGSPAEVNLKHHDIANMTVARYADASALLVGDIDRGGVFASFIGTLELLAEWERRLVAGFVVNRFRGQEALLGDALDYTERHTGKRVFGVVPFIADLNLPEEDSVTFKSRALDKEQPSDNHTVKIAVVDLPHISNFTDFDPFRAEDDVQLRIVRSCAEINNPDAVIIPGSKNTLGDLTYLKQSGLAERITQLAASGQTEIVGICGGFQMLGREISDPARVESMLGTAPGLNLLEVRTVMAVEKTLLRSQARHALSGLEVQGYEIHHGQTDPAALRPLFVRSASPARSRYAPARNATHSVAGGPALRAGPDQARNGEIVGLASADGRIWGTYLHGVFDADEFRRWFIDRLRVHRGLPAIGCVKARYDIEPALERLAQIVRRSLRMDEIYRLMGLK